MLRHYYLPKVSVLILPNIVGHLCLPQVGVQIIPSLIMPNGMSIPFVTIVICAKCQFFLVLCCKLPFGTTIGGANVIKLKDSREFLIITLTPNFS